MKAIAYCHRKVIMVHWKINNLNLSGVLQNYLLGLHWSDEHGVQAQAVASVSTQGF